MITGSHFFEAIVELTIWIADAHRDERKRFVVRADEKLTAFWELESAIRSPAIWIDKSAAFYQKSPLSAFSSPLSDLAVARSTTERTREIRLLCINQLISKE